jgi:hypothetical protein
MRKLITILLLTGVIALAHGQDNGDQAGDPEAGGSSNGGQASLRGLTPKRQTRLSAYPRIAAPMLVTMSTSRR